MNDIIVGMGEALWDVLPEGKKIGGAPANFAYHVSQFGFDSRVVSAVGEDKLGNEILKNFDAKKLNYLIEKVPYPTGTVQVELDPNGVPMYDIKENVAWDNIPFNSALEELAKKTRSVCFGSLAQRSVVSRETINSFLNAMPDGEGQCKIFDVNLRQGFYTKEILCNSMKRCNILKINDEELVTVSRMFGYPGIDLQAVALRGVEIAAAHPNIAHDVFEGFFHCQVAERNPAPGDFQIGDLQHRSRSRSGFRSRFGGLFRGFGRRLHQRRDVVALGRQFGVQGESSGVEPFEPEPHPPQVAFGEFHAQRVEPGHGLPLRVRQDEIRQRGRAFGAQGQQVFGVAPQPDVGPEASSDIPDVEPLAEVGEHAPERQGVEFQPDVELRGVDVVGDARGQRTAFGEVQHGAHVGFFASEIDARDLQVDVVEPHTASSSRSL